MRWIQAQLYIPSAAVEEQVRQAFCELLSGGIGRGEDADAARDAPLGCRSPIGQDPHGPGADVQPSAPGLDRLLWALLQVHAVSGLSPLQRHAREVGHAEIQTTAPPSHASAQV